jgi:peptide/nickel transport system substrate-binding protein
LEEERLKKLLIPLVFLLVCVILITGCSSAATTTATTTPAATTSTTAAPGTTTPVTTTPGKTTPAGTPTATPTTTTPAASANPQGGVLRIIEPVSPGTPIGAPWETSGESVRTQQISLQALLREELDGSMTYMLSTAYTIVTDPANPSITFTLRKGVKFQDGTDFNAQAVKFNLDKFKEGGMVAGTTNYWKSVEVVDDYTVRINYTEYRNTLLRSMGDAFFMVSPTAFQKNGIDWMRWNMVGTGPFVQKDFQRDVLTKVTRNTNYWDPGKPSLDEVQYLYVADE